MTEVISGVYDIGQPTPVSLEKLSAIAVSLEIWRRKVNEYRESHTLERFDPQSSRVPLETVLPGLPPAIYKIIYEYVRRFGFSLRTWASGHYRLRNLLEDFDDFVCDYDGSIHYVRTAERAMRCDRFDDTVKFNIACTYFLEDDIRRIWPFVSKSIDIDSINFNEFPQMYYWICRLTNKLDTITLTEGNVTIDEEMFDRLRYSLCNMPSVEYFWNGVSREKQSGKASGYNWYDVRILIRIILPKLDDQQLDRFVNCSGWELIKLLLVDREWIDEELVLGIWLYIRNIMNGSMFKLLVADMLRYQYSGIEYYYKDSPEDRHGYNADVVECRNKRTFLCCDIWNDSPLNLKSSVIRELLPGTGLLENENEYGDDDEYEEEGYPDYFHPTRINVELLLLILRCASIEERCSFWRSCWHLFIAAARGEELQRIMQLCFETRECEMAEFKQIMARSENVNRLCYVLWREGEYFDHLNGLVSFLLPDVHNARNFRQQILRNECLFLSSVYDFEPWTVRSAEKLNVFITSAYNDVDLPDGKSGLMSNIRYQLWMFIYFERVPIKELTKFIDAFVLTKETVVQIKMGIIDSIKKCVIEATARGYFEDIDGEPYFSSILLWCLGSDEEVDKFKLSIAHNSVAGRLAL